MKLAAAFLAGALGLWVLMQLLDNEPPPRSTAQVERLGPPDSGAQAQNTPSATQAPGRSPQRTPASPRQPADDTEPAVEASPSPSNGGNAEPQNPDTASTDIPDEAPLPTVERLNTVPPLAEPIPVPMGPEHQAVAEATEAIAELHAALESEPEDVAWAYEMQTHIQTFLLNNEQMQAFGNAAVHCRTALCEIQVIGYAPAAQGRWSTILGLMRLQPWFRNFTKTHGYSSGDGDQAVIFTFLERDPRTLEPAA